MGFEGTVYIGRTLLAWGCSHDEPLPAPSKPSTPDAGVKPEAGITTDVGAPPNASITDASVTDTSITDVGLPDATSLPRTAPPPPLSPQTIANPDGCAFPADVEIADYMRIACDGDFRGIARRLFSNPDVSARSWEPTEVFSDFRTIASFHQLHDGNVVVAHAGPDGVTIATPLSSTGAIDLNFEENEIPDLDGQVERTFSLNTPNGIGFIPSNGVRPDRIFVAVSNIDQADSQSPENTTYHGGRLVVADYTNGRLENAGAIRLSGKNATSVGAFDRNGDGVDDAIAVLSANRYAPNNVSLTDHAFIDIVDPSTRSVLHSIDLGGITAQIAARLSVDRNGIAVIAIQRPQKGFVTVDLRNASLEEPQAGRALPELPGFPAATALYSGQYGRIAIVGGFGIYGQQNGELSLTALDVQGWERISNASVPGHLGQLAREGNDLYGTFTIPGNRNQGTPTTSGIAKWDLSGL